MYWGYPSLNRPNQPVVGINWWEAVAYCRWLDELLHAEGRLSPDLEVRLPTEVEWESAAWLCGGGNCYAWTEGAPTTCAHVRALDRPLAEVKAIRSCGVGLFTFVKSRLDIYDLIGNVWEWTCSRAEPYSAHSFEQICEIDEHLADRVARGSSWLSSEIESAEITFRSFDPPYNAYEDLGFRVCIGARNNVETT